MEKRCARLECVVDDEGAAPQAWNEFNDHFRKTLLLALRERGRLTAMEYRRGEDKLKQKRLERAKGLLGKGEEE